MEASKRVAKVAAASKRLIRYLDSMRVVRVGKSGTDE